MHPKILTLERSIISWNYILTSLIEVPFGSSFPDAMLYLATLLTLLQCSSALAQSTLTSNITAAFSQAKVVPDVIHTFNPTALVNITFTEPTTMQVANVTPGIQLTMNREPPTPPQKLVYNSSTTTETAMEPQFFLGMANGSNSSSSSADQMFVLALVDPDAPTPQNPNVSEFLHFLGGDFGLGMGRDPTQLLNQSAALTDFFPPTPPAGSDPHR